MTGPSQDAFQELGEKLRAAARTSLAEKNPEYVRRFRELADKGVSVDTHSAETKALLKGDELSEWIPILEAYFELDRRMRKIRHAVRLLSQLPPNSVLRAYGLAPGAWIVYHVEQCVITLSSLLECAEKLAKGIIRKYHRSKNANWKAQEKRLVDGILRKLRENIDPVRHQYAHTRGSGVERLKEEHLWEPYLLIDPAMDFVEEGYKSFVGYHQRWHARLHDSCTAALAAVFGVSRELIHLAFETTQPNKNHTPATGGREQ